MKVTLRKAAALQTSINDALKSISLNTSVSINEFQDGEAVIAEKSSSLTRDLERKVALTQALYAIRKAVGAANASNGVDDTLAEVALQEKLVAIYTALGDSPERVSPGVVAGKLAKLANRKEDARSYLVDNEVSTSVLTAAEIATFKVKAADCKKAKQKLQDKLLELNVRNDIELGQEVVDVLVKENLL